MVRAVSAGGAGAPVELRFALQGRPTAGQPLEIEVAITAVTPVERLRATFQGGEAFEVQAGPALGPLQRPQVGQSATHRVTVVPRADGIFNLSAVVLVEQASGELARTFAIPVIVGEGLGEGAEAPASAADGATGGSSALGGAAASGTAGQPAAEATAPGRPAG